MDRRRRDKGLVVMIAEPFPGLDVWLRSGNRGASARSIVARLTGADVQRGDYPSDAADFWRCEALLDAVPAFRLRLSDMADVNAYWRALVPHWDAIRVADKSRQYEQIRAILDPVQDADPNVVRLGSGMHLTFGPVTFQGAENSRRIFRRRWRAD